MLNRILIGFALLLTLACSGNPVRDSQNQTAAAPSAPVSSNKEIANLPAPPAQHLASNMPKFDWPVDQARMTRGFFLKDPRGHSRRPHLGIDLAAPRETPIYASHDGTVIYVGREFHGYGRMIMVEGKGGWATLYAHLDKSQVKEGQIVKQGDLIANMGRTGHATGVHLHFEIRKQSGPVDPLLYLPPSKVAQASNH